MCSPWPPQSCQPLDYCSAWFLLRCHRHFYQMAPLSHHFCCSVSTVPVRARDKADCRTDETPHWRFLLLEARSSQCDGSCLPLLFGCLGFFFALELWPLHPGLLGWAQICNKREEKWGQGYFFHLINSTRLGCLFILGFFLLLITNLKLLKNQICGMLVLIWGLYPDI